MSIFEYNEELHIQMERNGAWAEGYAEGIHQRRCQIAIVMLDANEPLEKILRYSGLSPEEIERLQSQ